MSASLETVFREELATIASAIEAEALDLCDGREADMGEILRRIHTLKGNAFAMGYTTMGELSHAVEDALEGSGDLAAVDRPALGDLLLDTLDVLTRMAGDPDAAAPTGLLDRFRTALTGGGGSGERPGGDNWSGNEPERRPAVSARQGFTLSLEAERVSDVFRRLERVHFRHGSALDTAASAEIGALSRALLDLQRVSPQPLTRRLRRAAREAERQTGKSVAFEVTGADDRLDASLAHDLGDTLPHVVRNAIDHGLESDGARASRGKPVPGRVDVRFRSAAGELRVEVSDDGAGMDPDRIAGAAVRRGLLGEADVSRLSRAERLRLVFRPGFSTADSVSEVSGRGIGMDVVARMARRRGGSVDIRSEIGRGTTFVIRCPVEFRWAEFLLVERGDWTLGVPIAIVASLGAADGGADVSTLDLREFPARAATGPASVTVRVGERSARIRADRLRVATAAVVRGAPSGSVPPYVAGLAMVDGSPVWVLDPAGIERDWDRLTADSGRRARARSR